MDDRLVEMGWKLKYGTWHLTASDVRWMIEEILRLRWFDTLENHMSDDEFKDAIERYTMTHGYPGT